MDPNQHAPSQRIEPLPYTGPDRRHNTERREGHDRREMIRFELDKEDRRSGKDRRRQDGWGKQQSRY